MFDNSKTQILSPIGVKFKTAVNGAELSAFKTGGAVPLVFYPESALDIIKLKDVISNTFLKYKVLGLGTNTLIDDAGFDGIVIATKDFNGIRKGAGDREIEVDPGASIPRLSAFARQFELSGLEPLSGIPGSVGGGLYMNAGAFGSSLGELLSYVEILDAKTRKSFRVDAKDMAFSYRSSRLKGSGDTVLKAVFLLKPSSAEAIAKAMADYKKRRADSQPKEPSLGSVFKRENGIIPAALIDKAGLKGYNIGGAGVSDKHAGFIVNCGAAASSDYRRLVEFLKNKIREKYGIELREEIELL